jgi:nitrite reductase/ring-hydroxylating ferredoxin subunit/alkylhydroperoxidase/carboxymuconolactone decarboxylase family protein YurZ
MSDALAYLVKARPEAMGHYLAFLKDCGTRLDPKTRNLISVITKVHAQTERGLRQYVKRALRDGCSAAEVLDAVLMAFPALGLSKILWAVDILLAMDLPDFRLDAPESAGGSRSTAQPSTVSPPASASARPSKARAASVAPVAPAAPLARDPTWHDVMAIKGHADGHTVRVSCDGRGLFVTRQGRRFSVYDSRCPHQATDIPELALQGGALVCPKHGWTFSLGDGRCTAVGDAPLQAWDCKVVRGRLLAHW